MSCAVRRAQRLCRLHWTEGWTGKNRRLLLRALEQRDKIRVRERSGGTWPTVTPPGSICRRKRKSNRTSPAKARRRTHRQTRISSCAACSCSASCQDDKRLYSSGAPGSECEHLHENCERMLRSSKSAPARESFCMRTPRQWSARSLHAQQLRGRDCSSTQRERGAVPSYT
jgi:hypothetical protein